MEELEIYKNVSSYKLSDSYDTWIVCDECGESIGSEGKLDEIKNESENYYFIIENQFGSDAFAHWCFESAIYVPLFLVLKKNYPNIKLVMYSYKNFKKLFLEKLGVSVLDITSGDRSGSDITVRKNDIVYELHTNNTCFFVKPTSLNQKNIDTYYKDKVDIFCNLLNYGEEKNKIRDIIMLPRQKLENFKPNDRVYNTEKLEEKLKNRAEIMHTDKITNLYTQINSIKESKNIILTDGSPFLDNGIFAKNSNIYIIGNITPCQSQTFPKLNYIISKISMQNKIFYTTIEQLEMSLQ